MIDLHSHVLPGIDDGAPSVEVSMAMIRIWVEQGVRVVACTPHILPGVYHNTGPGIREAVANLQAHMDALAIPVRLVTGADNHIVPTFVRDLRRGHLLTIGDTRYVLVEPPHHSFPARMEDLFHELQVNGYVPILTHPERLSWVFERYSVIAGLADRGVLMQLTAGSVAGLFGRRVRDLCKRLLLERRAHIVASDAHNATDRSPDLQVAWEQACAWVGRKEAENLFTHRPRTILENVAPGELPACAVGDAEHEQGLHLDCRAAPAAGGFAQRMRRLFVP